MFLWGDAFPQEYEILSSGEQNYRQIVPTNITKEILYFNGRNGADSIQIKQIGSIRILTRNGIPTPLKGILAAAYFSMFFYMLEAMYEYAPFTIPQFSGVFSVLCLTGAGAGILYGKLIKSGPRVQICYDFSAKPLNEKYTILKQIITNSPQSMILQTP